MIHRNQRLNVVGTQFSKHSVIEIQPFPVRFFFFTGRIDAAPGNRQTESLCPHFCQQRNIFLVAMIEIRALTERQIHLVLMLFVVKITLITQFMRIFRTAFVFADTLAEIDL